MSFTDDQRKEIEMMISDKLNHCMVEVDRRVDHIHTDMSQLRKEFHEFRKEFTEFTNALSGPLERIAHHMETLAGLPEAWQNFKGFVGFMKWIKDNVLAIATIAAIAIGSTVAVMKALF